MFLLEWWLKLFGPKKEVVVSSEQENITYDRKPVTHIRDVGKAEITIRFFNSKNKIIKRGVGLAGNASWVPINIDGDKALAVSKAKDLFPWWLKECAERGVYPIGYDRYIPASRVIRISVNFVPHELKFEEPDLDRK